MFLVVVVHRRIICFVRADTVYQDAFPAFEPTLVANMTRMRLQNSMVKTKTQQQPPYDYSSKVMAIRYYEDKAVKITQTNPDHKSTQ